MVAWLNAGVRIRSQLSLAFPDGNSFFLSLQRTVDWTSMLELTKGKFYPDFAFLLHGRFSDLDFCPEMSFKDSK